MTIIYVAENNCESLAVTVRNKGWIRIQRLKDVSDNENIIYEVNPMETFIGKSLLCNMTEFSGADDKEVFDGNTILLRIGEENNKHRYVYIGGNMVCSFLTNDKFYKYVSNMGNKLSPYSIAIGCENIYYLTPYFRYIKKKTIDIDDNGKLFEIDYDTISKYQKLRAYKIYSNHDYFLIIDYFRLFICIINGDNKRCVKFL